MSTLQIFAIWAALSGAVFPFSVSAGEWEEYQELKAAMVRSDAKRDRPLPKWLTAENFEPRPHYRLELPRRGFDLANKATEEKDADIKPMGPDR